LDLRQDILGGLHGVLGVTDGTTHDNEVCSVLDCLRGRSDSLLVLVLDLGPSRTDPWDEEERFWMGFSETLDLIR